MHHFIVLLLSLVVVNAAILKSSDTISELYKISVIVKKCLISPEPGICLKERALEALNETMYLEEPIQIGFISIRKNENYHINESLMQVTSSTNSVEQRSASLLNDALAEKLKDFFKSRTIQFNVNDALEGKKLDKGGGGGKGGKGGMMMMMMAGAAACVGTGMMMGKMGMMAMSALMLSKISLLLSVVMLLKKLKGGGGGGGEEKEKIVKVLYAASAGGHDWQTKGGGGGGYNSRNYYEPQISAQSMAYRAENPHDVNNGVVYQGV